MTEKMNYKYKKLVTEDDEDLFLEIMSQAGWKIVLSGGDGFLCHPATGLILEFNNLPEHGQVERCFDQLMNYLNRKDDMKVFV